MQRLLTKSLIIKVLALGSIFAFVIAGGVYAYETLWSGKVYITVTGPAATINWSCPIGGQALIAPYPVNGRPLLTASAPCSGITASDSAQLWGIYYLDETTGTWLYYIPGFTSSMLTQLEPGKYYYVVVSQACTLIIPQ